MMQSIPTPCKPMGTNQILHIPGASSHACIKPAPASMLSIPAGTEPTSLTIYFDLGVSLFKLRNT